MANQIQTVGVGRYRGLMLVGTYDPPLRVMRITGAGNLTIRTVDDPAGTVSAPFAVVSGETMSQWLVAEIVAFTGAGVCWS